MSAYARVDLPEPFGPMIAWTSFGSTDRSTPLTISVPSSSATCRFLISRSANFVRSAPPMLSRKRAGFVTHGSARLPCGERNGGILDEMPGWLGPWELLIVLAVVLLIFGPKRLPQ